MVGTYKQEYLKPFSHGKDWGCDYLWYSLQIKTETKTSFVIESISRPRIWLKICPVETIMDETSKSCQLLEILKMLRWGLLET